MRRQAVKGLLVDHELQFRRRLVPAGVVVRRDLLEAHVEIEGRPDPFQGVNRAALERRIELARGDVRHHDTQL